MVLFKVYLAVMVIVTSNGHCQTQVTTKETQTCQGLPNDWQTYPLEELEKLVNESMWIGARSQENGVTDILTHFRQHWQKVAEQTKADMVGLIKYDQPYGPNLQRQLFDIYGTDLQPNAPTLFWIHGGYWQAGTKSMTALLAGQVYRLGIRTIAFEYTLAPEGTIFDMQEEVKQGLAKVAQLYPVSKIIVAGHSAGAQLSAQLLHDWTLSPALVARIQGFILYSGVYDLRPVVDTYVNEKLQLTPQSAKDLSLIFNNRLHPFFLITFKRVDVIYGGMESPLFQSFSIDYSLHLKRLGLKRTVLTCLERDDHFSAIEDLDSDTSDSGRLFYSVLRSYLSM